METDAVTTASNYIESTHAISVERAAEALLDALTRQHRTDQQVFLSALKLTILKYASQPCDLRNDAAVFWAKQVAALPNSDLRFPYY